MAAAVAATPSPSVPPLFLLTSLLTVSPLLYIILFTPHYSILHHVLSPLAAYTLTAKLIPSFAAKLLKANIYGKDIGKKGTEREGVPVPEAVGLVVAIVTLALLCCVGGASGPAAADDDDAAAAPLHTTPAFLSALFTVLFSTLLGFTDDVLDWPWRVKVRECKERSDLLHERLLLYIIDTPSFASCFACRAANFSTISYYMNTHAHTRSFSCP